MKAFTDYWVHGLTWSCCGLALAVLLSGCSDSEAPEAAAPEERRQAADTVDQAKIDNCGGFTTETAAKILGVPANEIEGTNRLEHDTLRICSFRSRNDFRKSLSFSLTWEPSSEEARDSMASERENLGLAGGAIGGVTGMRNKGPSFEEITGLGDEAFYNGARTGCK